MTLEGAAKIPCWLLQAKYRVPLTEPSLVPLDRSSSTPTQNPEAKCTAPVYLTTPVTARWDEPLPTPMSTYTRSPTTILRVVLRMSAGGEEGGRPCR